MASNRAISLATIVTVLYTLAAYNYFLAIIAGVLSVLDALNGTIGIAMDAGVARFFWVLAGLAAYRS